ncbi:hypothetical protein C6H68_22630 [Photorhabdus luminescens]|nr:hypothetical protein C6H68_22630 [Photorhabdus luminescens]
MSEFGDPSRFAIFIEYISDWSTSDGYKNGLFHFCIDGEKRSLFLYVKNNVA